MSMKLMRGSLEDTSPPCEFGILSCCTLALIERLASVRGLAHGATERNMFLCVQRIQNQEFHLGVVL